MTLTRGASLMCCFREVDDPRKPSNGTLHDFLEILVTAIAGSMSFRVETAYAEGHRGYDEVKGGRSPGEAEPLTSPYPRQRFRKADGGRQPPSAWRTIATFRLYRDRS